MTIVIWLQVAQSSWKSESAKTEICSSNLQYSYAQNVVICFDAHTTAAIAAKVKSLTQPKKRP